MDVTDGDQSINIGNGIGLGSGHDLASFLVLSVYHVGVMRHGREYEQPDVPLNKCSPEVASPTEFADSTY